MAQEITLIIGTKIESIYSDEASEVLEAAGSVSIARASHVEPGESGVDWFADLSPVGGPKLGPFGKRSLAIDAEILWLQENRGL
ncbi:MAG: hypothetical protein ACK5XN_00505 [Bacteroidota bacterium]|jgi:hypothetical protein